MVIPDLHAYTVLSRDIRQLYILISVCMQPDIETGKSKMEIKFYSYFMRQKMPGRCPTITLYYRPSSALVLHDN